MLLTNEDALSIISDKILKTTNTVANKAGKYVIKYVFETLVSDTLIEKHVVEKALLDPSSQKDGHGSYFTHSRNQSG